MTRKRQLINEIADLIVERLDERSRLDELSPGYLKGMQQKIQGGEYGVRGQVINSKIEQHYTVWLEREVLEPIAQIMQKILQTLSSENVIAEVGPETYAHKNSRGRGPFFDCHFIISKGDKTEAFYARLIPDENGFKPLWASEFERELDTIITYLIREGEAELSPDTPLTRDERAVVDKILILIGRLLRKPDIVDGAKTLLY